MSDIEGLTLDGLNVNDLAATAPHLELEIPPTFPAPKPRRNLVSGADSDGAVPSDREDHYDLTEHTLKVRASKCTTADQAFDLHGQIVDFLARARRTQGGLPLVWTPGNGTRSFTKYVVAGDLTEMPLDLESGYLAGQPVFTYTLLCRPFGYGAEQLIADVTSSNPLVTVELADVPGDVRAEGRMVVTDTANKNRRNLEWGLEQIHYDPGAPAPLLIDSDALTTAGFNGTLVSRIGSYGNKVVKGVPAPAPTSLCAIDGDHVGRFRLRLLVTAPTRVSWRVVYGPADGQARANPWVSTPGDTGVFDIDLGLLTLSGHAWRGRVEFMHTGAAVSDAAIDLALLIPADEGYGHARAGLSYEPVVPSTVDSFNSGSGVLNGKSPTAGPPWVTVSSGGGPELNYTSTSAPGFGDLRGHQVAALLGPDDGSERAALMGSATGSAAEVGVEALGERAGVVARFTDFNNMLFAGILDATPTSITIAIWMRVAGVETTLTYLGLGRTLAPTGVLSIRLLVYPSGTAYLFANGFAGLSSTGVMAPLPPMALTAWSAQLATGGALATGKLGIYAFSNPGYFDNFYTASPGVEPTVLRPGRRAEIRHDGALLETPAGSTYTPQARYRGARMLIPPAAAEGLTSRLAVRATQHDPGTAVVSHADQVRVQVYARPRYLAFPRA
jgi:hypothetical protein